MFLRTTRRPSNRSSSSRISLELRRKKSRSSRESFVPPHILAACPPALEPRPDSIQTNFGLSMRLLIHSVFSACTLAASILHSHRLEHSRITRLNVMRRFMAEKEYEESQHGRSLTGRATSRRRDANREALCRWMVLILYNHFQTIRATFNAFHHSIPVFLIPTCNRTLTSRSSNIRPSPRINTLKYKD
jgi:hypothetical protein